MVTINTNLQSLIVQKNLTNSTNALNLAIERMTTGFKLNHASDNAANYSIANNMVSQLSSYDIASNNISMGKDLVQTAQDSISLMQNHGQRIHDLITQALNGTYGKESQKAIASEINARISEINRLYQTTEYNDINLFDNMTVEVDDTLPKAGENGFIDQTQTQVEYTTAQVNAMTSVSSVTGNYANGTKYKISTVAELKKLANDVNSGKTHTGAIFVLANDLDLSEIENWTPIGDNHTKSAASRFRGTFNGNGHTISNLTVNNPDTDYQGLFGFVVGTIKNTNLENVDVSGNQYVGGIVGYASSTQILNCASSGNISGNKYSGGIAGVIVTNSKITNSYSSADVSNDSGAYTGGLVGQISSNSIVENCYATGNVSSLGNNTGGLTGAVSYNSQLKKCYATGDVSGTKSVGGLSGIVVSGSSVNNCYSTGIVNGEIRVGGLIGTAGCSASAGGDVSISNSVSYSMVYGDESLGNLIGVYQKDVIYPLDYTGNHGDAYEYTSNLTVTSCSALNIQGISGISGAYVMTYNLDGSYDATIDESYDINALLSNITLQEIQTNRISIQVGINGNSSDSIAFDTNFLYGLSSIIAGDRVNKNAYTVINNFLDMLSEKSTQLGAVSNRLDSALESTTVSMNNLTSSLSTIRDADIATESSAYIKSQILQQAAATLLATANQSPSIALQLI